MNREPSYEKLIAEKLQDLPMPDMETSWQHMKLLLDKEMPESGAIPPPPRGRGGWWIAGSVLSILAILIGTWVLYPVVQPAAEKTVAASSLATENQVGSASTSADAAFDQNNAAIVSAKNNLKESSTNPSTTTKPEIKNNASAKNIQESEITTFNKNIALSNGRQTKQDETATVTDDPAKRPGEQENAVANHSSANGQSSTAEVLAAPEEQNLASTNNGNQQDLTNTAITNTTASGSIVKDQSTIAATENLPVPAVPNQALQTGHEGRNYNSITELTMETAGATGEKNFFYQLASVPRENYLYSNRHSLTQLPDSSNLSEVEVPASVWQLPDVEKQRKAILKQMKKEERRNERELAKSYRTTRSFWGASTDRWFAAGIAPYQSVAVGSQQTYGYNSGGTRGIATDYIPAPYLQLHITDRVYVLSEFQFHTPQATPNLLLAQRTNTAPQAAWNVENIYLRKMYYFNMPLSFYYSPFKNVYVGSGLQFSSFNSGLAYREQRGANNSIVQSDIVKIREDSLSSLISSSEWRYLVDANYYVNRFMFGLRYNQALSNYVNLKSITNMPASQARNQAFQLYVRYNLVVTKKKR